MFGRFAAFVIAIGAVTAAFGQGPWDIAKTKVKGKNVSIEYGRPVLAGRTVESLLKQLPPDRVWRAGAGPVTILSTETDLAIGGRKVPAGNYSLYMHCPEKGDYSLIVNSETGQTPGQPLPKATPNRENRDYPAFAGYTTAIGAKEVARVPLKKIPAPNSQILSYSFEPAGEGAVLTIHWGDQAWTTEIQPAQ